MSPDSSLTLLRQDAADRWLSTLASRRPTPAHDARYLRAAAQARRAPAGPSEDLQRLLAEAARHVRERAAAAEHGRLDP